MTVVGFRNISKAHIDIVYNVLTIVIDTLVFANKWECVCQVENIVDFG